MLSVEQNADQADKKKLALVFDRIGSLYFSKNDFENAEKSFQQAVNLNTKNGNFKAHLATTLVQLDDKDSAELILKTAIKEDETCFYIEAVKNLANLYGMMKKHTEAAKILEDCIGKIRNKWKSTKQQAQDLIQDGDDFRVKHNKRLKAELASVMVEDEMDSEQIGDLDFSELFMMLGSHYRKLADAAEKMRLKLHGERSKDTEALQGSMKEFKSYTQKGITAFEDCLKLDYRVRLK